MTGGGFHDYPAQKEILPKGITDRVNAAFTIDDAGTKTDVKMARHGTPGWSRNFDLVIYNICFADVKDNAWSEAIVREHVVNQVPAMVIHCAIHTYNFRGDSPIWSMFMGVRSQRHQRQMPITVEVVDAKHAVMANFPASWPNPQAELYEILDVYPTATVLAHAFGEESKKNQPVFWTNRFAGVRVFGTTIGHHNQTMQSKEYLDLIANGVLWATNKLDDTGKPLPGYAK
jgi:type 1 glutamine amidotransferase